MNIQPKPCLSTTQNRIKSIELNKTELSDTENDSIQSVAKQNKAQIDEGNVISESEAQLLPIEYELNTWPPVISESFCEHIVKSRIPPNPKQCIKYPQQNGRSFNEKHFYSTQANVTPYKHSLAFQCIICFTH